jgi:hypothetical protein
MHTWLTATEHDARYVADPPGIVDRDRAAHRHRAAVARHASTHPGYKHTRTRNTRVRAAVACHALA